MRVESIDLYDWFELPRPEGARGFLSAIAPDAPEMVRKRRRFPAILILPGGGYNHVSDREGEPVALRYLAHSFATFTLDYSVAPLRYPTALLEAAMAMVYIRNNEERFCVDAQRVAALGFSAGGHLCGCLSFLYGEAEVCGVLGERARFVRPDAAVFAYPVITSGEKAHRGSFECLCGNDEALMAALSLETRVHAGAPPAFVWHTFSDQTVSVKNSLLLAEAYERAGVPFSLHVFEKGHHGVATADGATNAMDTLPIVSAGVTGWIDESVLWLGEHGIAAFDF